MNWVGKAVPHESAAAHVTGSALFTDDLLSRFPGLLHAWPVLAPHAHAEVISIDASDALSSPGVVTVLTGEDVPGEGDIGVVRRDEPLFPTEVCHFHQPLAWVLAESLEQAREATIKVAVEYRVLGAILTIEQAIEQQSFLLGPVECRRENAETAIAEGPVRVQGELRIGGQEHFYLETQCAIAWRDETGVSLCTPLRSTRARRRQSSRACSEFRSIRSRSNAFEWAALSEGRKFKRISGRPLPHWAR